MEAPAPKRARTQGTAASAGAAARSVTPGTIARVRLHNFMSYRDADIVDPGTRLNCIVGPNGTGKSSIVCAMCVGLGGQLKLTGRGDEIRSCVHGEGKTPDEQGQLITSGFVETELVDGSGPGRNLTVRLDFNVDNRTSWQLDGRKAKQSEVKERMAQLNIQVDNPLQFLPQDKVGEFSNMSPVQLLQHTEMAIGPATHEKHRRLIDDDKELAAVKQRLATEQKSLDDLEKQNKALERDVERFRELQQNKKKLDSRRGKVLWVRADVLREGADAANVAYAAVEAALKGVKNEVKERERACKPLDEALAKFDKEVKAVKAKAYDIDTERVKSTPSINKLMEEQEKLVRAERRVQRTFACVQHASRLIADGRALEPCVCARLTTSASSTR